ncbi:hypothetical protein RUM43_006858 [Polyplax serrata]|uniref:Uncharacterized protein n=1 Tax=Polyplax serrata TaxID=468196 RepID=A0AAN8PBS8_POLSC
MLIVEPKRINGALSSLKLTSVFICEKKESRQRCTRRGNPVENDEIIHRSSRKQQEEVNRAGQREYHKKKKRDEEDLHLN